MLYEYKTSTGTVKIEVEEKWARFLEESDKEMESIERRETRRHVSLNTEEGSWLACEDSNIRSLICENESDIRVRMTLRQMKPAQRRILIAIYFDGIKQEEYAAKLGINQSNVSRRSATAEKNFRIIFSKTA